MGDRLRARSLPTAVAGAGLAGIVLATAIGLWTVADDRDVAARLDRVRTADEAAAVLEAAIARNDVGVERYLNDGTIEASATGTGRAEAARALVDAAVGLPGERDAIAAFEDAAAEYDDATAILVERVLAGDDDGPAPIAVVTTLRSSSEAMAVAVDALRTDVYAPARVEARVAADDRGALHAFLLWVVGGAGAVTLGVLALLDRRRRSEVRAAQATVDAEIADFTTRAKLEGQLGRALEMAAVENDAWAVFREAAAGETPDVGLEVLAADSSRAHFHRAVSAHDEHLGAGCAVGSPTSCPATQRGATLRFDSGNGLDSCPFLRARDLGERGAACVPMSVAGNTIAVAHAVSPVAGAPSDAVVQRVELIARKTADRVGLLRSMAENELQATTDPLTGLVNRRSLYASLTEVVGDRPYAVVFIDVDRFKQLNDTHGHEVGDRALRLLGAVARRAVRPTDLLCRYGGEEFVVVAPDADTGDGVRLATRLQEELTLALHGGTVPAFTLSAGVADAIGREHFDQALRDADAALLVAKQAGRNRVVRADDVPEDAAARRLQLSNDPARPGVA